MRVEVEEIATAPELLLRPEDVVECEVLGLTPEQSIAVHMYNSVVSYVAKVDGKIAAVFGLRPLSSLNLQVHVWMFSTPAMAASPVVAARASKRLLGWLLAEYRVVVCWVHRDYSVARRWLEWLGFHHVSDCKEFLEMRAVRGGR